VYPIKHKLKECTMLKNYMTSWSLTMGKPKGDPGERLPHPSPRKSQAINIVNLATLEYHRWSESVINFDQTNH
jgi:hypothetical protein